MSSVERTSKVDTVVLIGDFRRGHHTLDLTPTGEREKSESRTHPNYEAQDQSDTEIFLRCRSSNRQELEQEGPSRRGPGIREAPKDRDGWDRRLS
ncbi:hypothetical protein N7541_010043 [Penicillium brevicompactum]|uniref:Uncharacterized protein n=1 Tax=Penicillium brevicompactum TaxID=5074 RepID=A0A9W9QQT9_PENBR|nr:uncharacterized protein N7506_010244 [Penicillium brevicompactum]KAJ5327142.1 hypothetical protein N7506_010244 [Penicillium brevicompactum]KAJ5340919.1 hypothetical protein N7541_010043 [Penicillium brevicompactum]